MLELSVGLAMEDAGIFFIDLYCKLIYFWPFGIFGV
jgi:hypothetical protein